jgi:hypothetical protein
LAIESGGGRKTVQLEGGYGDAGGVSIGGICAECMPEAKSDDARLLDKNAATLGQASKPKPP